MGTAKFDDGTPANPKVIAAGPVAAWLWFCSVLYCRRALTDGFIPKIVVPTLVVGLTAPYKHAARLVDVGLWHEALGGYQINDYLHWNPTKAAMEEYRKKDRERKHGKHGIHEEHVGGIHTESVRNPSAEALTRGTHAGTKSESESEMSGSSGSGSSEESPRETTIAFGDFWRLYPRKTGKGAALKAWDKAKPDVMAVLSALAWQVDQPGWLEEGGKFIPHPATWLNARRWEDEPFTPVEQPYQPSERTKTGRTVAAGRRTLAAIARGEL